MVTANANLLFLAGWAAAAVVVLGTVAEALHARRCARLGRLAFGPGSRPRRWTLIAPPLRIAALAGIAWSLITLLAFEGGTRSSSGLPPADRHLLVLLDVSPSMGLADAGSSGSERRAVRAAQALKSILDRVPGDRIKVTMACFYSDSMLLVKDCVDRELVWNFADDLPLYMAYRPGKTDLVKSINTAAGFVQDFPRKSVTALVLTDGDTLPDSGLKPLPSSVTELIVVGVGDPTRGTFIDGHLSRQDGASLSQLARRLGGRYHEGNVKQVPTDWLRRLNAPDERGDRFRLNLRLIAVAVLCGSAGLLCLLPVWLEFLGSGWKARRPALTPASEVTV